MTAVAIHYVHAELVKQRRLRGPHPVYAAIAGFVALALLNTAGCGATSVTDLASLMWD